MSNIRYKDPIKGWYNGIKFLLFGFTFVAFEY